MCGSREAGRACAVRPGPRASPRVGVRPRRVRRAGELHARRRDSGAGGSGRHRARGLRARPVLRSRRPGTVHHAGAGLLLSGGGLQLQRDRDRTRARARASVSLRGLRGSRRFLAARSTSCSCSRRCSRFPTRSRCSRRSRGADDRAGGSPSRSKRAYPSPTPSERGCPTPTRSGSPRSTEMLASLERVGLARPLAGGLQPVPPCRGGFVDRGVCRRRVRTSPRRSDSQALDELLTAHRLWSDWLGEGRVRKLALVTEKTC